ncbi:hypothetical protein DKT68_08510 [Micromonospora acroterricola]|uniref:Exonuclease n=1 Tax=Micromonospora acroterricola TaxID=2202421 RepID=A0A317D6U8_9ACTN|nr:hypothetical protein [Micromonospora acroterricola]PWR10591.1 hypothetical protein DKT68_08510 [Micromonospora acroterricola]
MSVDQATLDAVIASLTTKPAPAPKPHCLARCGERLDPMLVTDPATGAGWHIGCEPAAQPEQPVPPADLFTVVTGPAATGKTRAMDRFVDAITAPPPPTLDDLRALLYDHEANSARSRQKKIGPSEIGVPCQRALAYKLAGTPEQPDLRLPWAPIQGTAVHAYIADALTAHNEILGRERWIVEQKVWPDDTISGSGDAYDTDTGTVIDWKLVGDSSITKYRKEMRPEYRVQAHLYGLGHERAGRDVLWVRVVCLSRSWDYGKSWEWTEPYDPEIAQKALDRLYATEALLTDLDVANNPAMWGAIPATPTKDCRYCRFFRPNTPADDTGCPGNPDPWA